MSVVISTLEIHYSVIRGSTRKFSYAVIFRQHSFESNFSYTMCSVSLVQHVADMITVDNNESANL